MKFRPAVLAVGLVFAAAAPAYATTGSTTPDCAEHGHDAEHNPHCNETTTTSSSTTTTTYIVELPVNPTTTTGKTFVVPTTTTTTTGPPLVIEPPHLDVPADAPTTAPTAPAAVLSTHVDRLPRTGFPFAFYTALGLLCLLCGGGALYLRRWESHAGRP